MIFAAINKKVGRRTKVVLNLIFLTMFPVISWVLLADWLSHDSPIP
jgi:hypothetical protein